MKKAIIAGIAMFMMIGVFALSLSPASAYTSVGGYYRSNGTYVSPYVRSNPNGLRYDNYSWKPSQGYYNNSYYSPSRSYSWKTPSWETDSSYYTGRSLYNSYNSYPSYRSRYNSLYGY